MLTLYKIWKKNNENGLELSKNEKSSTLSYVRVNKIPAGLQFCLLYTQLFRGYGLRLLNDCL